MTELTADQRAELTRLHTRRGVSGAIPTHLDCSKVNAALDAAEKRATRDAFNSEAIIESWRSIAGQVKAKATEQSATLALADALAADVGKWHAWEAGMRTNGTLTNLCKECSRMATDPVHGEPLRAYTEARKP